jgi:anti-anti-sigma regulatory factor
MQFNLAAVTFRDSSGLHVLAQAQRAIAVNGRRTTTVCAPGNLRKIFDNVLTIVDDRELAFGGVA